MPDTPHDASAEAWAAHGEIAVGLIVANDGRVLLQHRDNTPGLPGANHWGLFGGHMEPNEERSATFLREIREELGWQPRHFEHYLTHEAEPLPGAGTHAHRSHIFAAHLDVPLDELTLGEGQDFGLFAPDALPTPIVPRIPPIIDAFVRTDSYKRVKRRWDIISTTALIVDARGHFLLQLRDDDPAIVNPGLWGSFGGRVEPHETDQRETPHAGFLREMREELAWAPQHVELYVSTPYRTLGEGDPRHQLIYVYTAPLQTPLDALTLGEGQAMGLFAPDALPEPIIPPLRDLIARFAATELYAQTVQRARR